MSTLQEEGLLSPLFGADALLGLFAKRARLEAMLDFEAAPARAQARCGVIPAAPVDAHPVRLRRRAVRANRPRPSDLARRQPGDSPDQGPHRPGRGGRCLGHPLRALGRHQPRPHRHRHGAAAAPGPSSHRGGPGPGGQRSGQPRGAPSHHHDGRPHLLQHALPITFGLKAADWLDALTRHRDRQAELRGRALVLQFGRAAGTLASLGEQVLAVSEALAEELGLCCAALPWHTHRDRLIAAPTVLGLLTGTLGKIGRDIALSMSNEVAQDPAVAAVLDQAALERLLQPQRYLGASAAFIDRALAAARPEN